MIPMNYRAIFGWAIVIYSVMFLAWSGFVIYGLGGSLWARIGGLAILVLVTTIAERSLRLSSWKDVLPYSLAWGVLVGLLDAIFSVPFAGWQIYFDWNVWLGYALVAIVPLLSARFFPRRFSSTPRTGIGM